MPARIVHKGSSRLLVPVSDHRHLENLAPNFETLTALGNELETDGFFVFAINRDSDEIWTESRMFCPAWGFLEDPVSGNAHAMLGAYLWDLGQFNKKSTTFIGRQGYQMKRPGQVRVRLEIDKGALVASAYRGHRSHRQRRHIGLVSLAARSSPPALSRRRDRSSLIAAATAVASAFTSFAVPQPHPCCPRRKRPAPWTTARRHRRSRPLPRRDQCRRPAFLLDFLLKKAMRFWIAGRVAGHRCRPRASIDH